MADKILAEIKRGDDAKKILENKVYIEAFETVKNNIIDAMRLRLFNAVERKE